MRSITNNNIIFFLASSSSNSNDVDGMGMLEQQNDQIMLAEETQLTEKDMNQYNALLLATDRIDHTIQMLDEKLCKYKYKSNKKGKIWFEFYFSFFFFSSCFFQLLEIYFYNLCKVILFLSKAFKQVISFSHGIKKLYFCFFSCSLNSIQTTYCTNYIHKNTHFLISIHHIFFCFKNYFLFFCSQ